MLPIPNEREVEEFGKICKEKMGLEMNGREALEVAMRVLQISYLRQYGLIGERRRQEIARLYRQEADPSQGDLPR
jgi:hypothetical protein